MGNSKSGYISPPLQKPKETILLSLEELNAACDDFDLRHPGEVERWRQDSTLRCRRHCNTIIKRLKNRLTMGESRCKWCVQLSHISDYDLEETKSLIKEKLSNTCYVLNFVNHKGTSIRQTLNGYVNIQTIKFNFKIDQPPSCKKTL